jgi:chemotaxis regulatin CheY-phosphate phosphatase CheZ
MTRAIADLITVPAQARLEIGELTSYLERALTNLKAVDGHLRDSSQTMPDVLDVLREVNRMTETATVTVLEQTEALVEDGRTAAALITAAHAAAGEAGDLAARLGEVAAVVARSNERALTIMSALEFQDLTSQKVQWAFKVLETVVARMRTIQSLVFGVPSGAEPPPPIRPVPGDPTAGATASAQDLADELLRGFTP